MICLYSSLQPMDLIQPQEHQNRRNGQNYIVMLPLRVVLRPIRTSRESLTVKQRARLVGRTTSNIYRSSLVIMSVNSDKSTTSHTIGGSKSTRKQKSFLEYFHNPSFYKVTNLSPRPISSQAKVTNPIIPKRSYSQMSHFQSIFTGSEKRK